MKSEQFSGPAGKTIQIPGNTAVAWSLVSQSLGAKSMLIKDPHGATIVDTRVLSKHMSNISAGSFRVDAEGTYTVLFPNDPAVLHQSAAVTNGRTVISETTVFGGEDGTDNDYQDAFAHVTWFSRIG